VPELPADLFCHFVGRLGMAVLVLDAELVPLEFAHLMEREDIYAFHISERRGEPGEFCDVVQVVRQLRYQFIAFVRPMVLLNEVANIDLCLQRPS